MSRLHIVAPDHSTIGPTPYFEYAKVFIAASRTQDGDYIYGVFSTKEKAEECLEGQRGYSKRSAAFVVYEWMIDGDEV